MNNPVSTGGSSVHARGAFSGVVRRILAAVFLLSAAAVHAEESLTQRENAYDRQIRESASDHGVDPMLIKAIIFTESSFFPKKTGRSGEIGLMQIREAVVEDWAKYKGVPAPAMDEIYDPDLNIEIGTWYIARALKRWYANPDFLRMALAEYNAGRKRLLQWLELYEGDTDRLLVSKPVGKYADKVCRKYVEYVVGNPDLDIPAEIQPNFASNF